MNSDFFKRLLSSIILIPLSFVIILKGSFYFNIFLIVIFLLSLFEWHNLSIKKIYYYPGMFFLFFSFSTVYFIRNFDQFGVTTFLFVICVSVLTDIGGYIFGKVFKGPKLITISPNKTYSGMFGGYLMSLLLYFLIPIFDEYFVFDEFWLLINNNLVLTILIISTISQIGDLLISYFKRLSSVKDTGSLIPGHGGILDRIDGMIFTFPFVFIFYYI